MEVGWRAFDGGDSNAFDEIRSRGKENNEGREQQSGHAISVCCSTGLGLGDRGKGEVKVETGP